MHEGENNTISSAYANAFAHRLLIKQPSLASLSLLNNGSIYIANNGVLIIAPCFTPLLI